VSVPVIDLKQKLGLTRGEPSDHTRIVILQVQGDDGDMVVGALADAVYEVTQLAHEGIEAPPRTGTAWDQSFMMGIARRQGRFVTVLDLDRVFSQASFDFPHHG
jgi:purine-binding chemotaxis protein CheW